MSICLKVVLVVFIVSLLYAAVIYAVGELIIYPGFVDLESKEAVENCNRIVQFLNGEAEHIKTFRHDWAAWDDTYQFVQDKNKDYFDPNLIDETFIDSKLDIIYIVDRGGCVIFGKVYHNDETIR